MLLDNPITQLMLMEGAIKAAWIRCPQMDDIGVYTYFFLPCT